MTRGKHKYGAIQSKKDGISFPSKIERRYYEKLKMLQESGEVLYFLRQPLFDLGGGVPYRADFQVFLRSGEISYIDVKGMETELFKAKKKIVEDRYPYVEIEVVKKV